MRFSFFTVALPIHAFGLEEAEQSVLLQTKQTVEKRVEQHDAANANTTGPWDGTLIQPITLSGNTELVLGNNNHKIKKIKDCAAIGKQPVCMMTACPSNGVQGWVEPECEHPQKVYVIDQQLCVGSCPTNCVCPPPPPLPTGGPPGPIQIQGRPFSTDAGHLVSTASWSSDGHSDWVPKDWKHVAPNMPRDVSEVGEDYWRKAGEHEHASIASFARASLDLMRFGAPPELLRDTHVAAMEEVKHAEISFGLAKSFKSNSSETLVVGAFPLDNAELSSSLDDFASKLLLEGCLGETSAVARLSYAIAHIDPLSPASQHLVTLRDEEAGHAALAWKSLAWAISKGAKVPPLPEPKLLQHQEPSDAESQALVWAGAVPSALSEQIDHAVLVSTVIPWVSALTRGQTELPAVSASGEFSEAVTVGTGRVHNRMQTVSI